MPRQFFRRITARFAPATDAVMGNPWLRKYLPAITDPDLWHLNRHSTARGIAIGLACGLIPGPLQVASTALICIAWRGNLPLAVVTTFYTNPLTIVPLYIVAYEVGRMFMPGHSNGAALVPPVMSFDLAGIETFAHWVLSLGPTLALGLTLLALTLSVAGYFGTSLAWRYHTLRAWRARARLREARVA